MEMLFSFAKLEERKEEVFKYTSSLRNQIEETLQNVKNGPYKNLQNDFFRQRLRFEHVILKNLFMFDSTKRIKSKIERVENIIGHLIYVREMIRNFEEAYQAALDQEVSYFCVSHENVKNFFDEKYHQEAMDLVKCVEKEAQELASAR